jgi:hypothetical protein
MGKNKRPHGHYCRICGQYKANEKFSGKGHAAHICKACHALPAARRNELARINEIARMSEGFFISHENLERLKKYATDKQYPEAREYAGETLNGFRLRMDEYHGNAEDDEAPEVFTPVTYSELSAPLKEEARSRLEELISYFINEAGCIPEEIDAEEILPMFCEEFCEAVDDPGSPERKLVPDRAMMSLFNKIRRKVAEKN